MPIKKLSTTAYTGYEFLHEGRLYKVGTVKHGKINLHIKINETSQITMQVSTRELNKLINQQ
jgi:hypothetical protein